MNLKVIEKILTNTNKEKPHCQMLRFSEDNSWQLFNCFVSGVDNIKGNYKLIYREEEVT